MLIQDIVKILTEAGIEQKEATVEVKLLLEHFANYSAVDILMGKKLDEDKLKIVEQKAKLRAKTLQPIQYIIGYAYFMGTNFKVTPDVLIPRDDTEILVQKSIEIINQNNYQNVMDMCTGSGCIACSIAKNTNALVLGVDISNSALCVAINNMENMKLFNRAVFRKSNLFDKIRYDEKFDMIVSNPPYIAPKFKQNIQDEVKFEPEIALFTNDEKGIEFYRKISSQAPKFLNKGGCLIFELGIDQSNYVKNIMQNNNFTDISIIKDLSGIDRVIYGFLNS